MSYGNRFVAEMDEIRAVGLCASCRHKHEDSDTCDAFEDGIPDEFLDGDEKHRSPVEGDGGIVYDPVIA